MTLVRYHLGVERIQPDDAMVDYFIEHDAEYDLGVQLRADLDTMQVEDASVAWPEDRSSHRTVARLTLPRPEAYN